MKKKFLLVLVCSILFLGLTIGCNDSNISKESSSNETVENDSNDDTTDVDISSMSYDEAKEYLDNLPETDASYFKISTEDMNEGEAAITYYSGTDEIVVIPEKIDGLTIVQLSKWSFTNNDTVVAVKVPETVKVLDNSAFEICSNLVYVTGLENVEKLGDAVFNGSIKLKYLKFSDSVTEIKGYIVFYNKNDLTIEAPKDSYIANYVKDMIDSGDDYLNLKEY